MERIRYFDHAASSWPKPDQVVAAMNEVLRDYAANPGRGSHQLAVKASRALFNTRENLARLFGVKNPNDIFFAQNATMALNTAILGYVRPGEHVISTMIEHNSVRRPLEYLRQTKQVEITYLPADSRGNINLNDLRDAFRPNTSLVVGSHSSNLLGTILPIADIAEISKKHHARLLVDAAQTAGTFPIDVIAAGIDMLAFPGHKGLLGPQGTGGLYVNPALELEPILFGGTGSLSESAEQPDVRPDRYEAGTQNTVGVAGLGAGVEFVLHETVNSIHHKEWRLIQRLMEGLARIGQISMYGPELGADKTGIISFNFAAVDSAQAAFILDREFGICVRSGHHCTPLAHESVGTIKHGAVRASVGFFSTEDDVDYFVDAARQIAQVC